MKPSHFSVIMIHLLAFFVFVLWMNYKLLKYNAPLWIMIICELLYAFNPIIAMFASCSSKDVMFSVFFVVLTFELYEILSAKEKVKISKIVVFFLSLIICILYRNNFIYALIVFIPLFIIFNRDHILKRKYILLTFTCLVAAGIGLMIKGPIYDYLKVCNSDSTNEMISIPSVQIARSAKYDSFICEKLSQNGISTDRLIDEYNNAPENSDIIRLCFYPTEGKIDLIMQCWKQAIIEHPSTSLDAALKLTQAAWQPFKKITAYVNINKSVDKKTSLFACFTEEPGVGSSKIPALQDFLYRISHNAILEDNPLFAWMVSPAVYLWFALLVLAYSIINKNKAGVLVLLFYMLIIGTFLLGPCVLIRYYYYLFIGLPLFLIILFKLNKIDIRLDSSSDKHKARTNI